MKLQSTYDCGIYARLSKDDNNGNLESMSIQNQRQMLMDYVTEKGWNLREIYVDDGYTGTNFERPDFQRMIRDAEKGKINCIIAKDLSRFGRNYVKTGYYIEEFFPEMGVRFIAVNDSIDTQQESNDIAPFQNILNEWYPKDISKKVRQVIKSSARQGKFMGSHAPYGYRKSPEDKHILLIDEPAAEVLRRIRDELFAGLSARHIAERLTSDGIDSPYCYRLRKEGRAIPVRTNTTWGSATIIQLMQNPALAGDMVQGKRKVLSFKTKKRVDIDPEDWIVVRDTHEAIFSRADFQRLADILTSHKKTKRVAQSDAPALFAGVLKCADCGAILAYSHKELTDGTGVGVYRCTKYVNNGKVACSVHRIQENALEAIVLADIRAHARMAAEDRQRLCNRLLASLRSGQSGESALLRKKLKEIVSRQFTISDALKNLYLDKCTGKLPETVFQGLMNDFTREQAELDEKRGELNKRLLIVGEAEDNVREWVNRIEECLSLEKLDRETVMGLIESIVVHESVKVQGQRAQEIEISYRFVGVLASQNTNEDIA